MILHLSGELTEDLLQTFISKMDLAINMPECPTIDIYLHSNGGYERVGIQITDIINEYAQDFNITLIASAEISSAAFELFFNSRCYKRILPKTVGMFHKGRDEVTIIDGATYDLGAQSIIKSSKISSEYNEVLIKRLGFNAKESGIFHSSEDVFFHEDRLKEFLLIDENNKSNREAKIVKL